MFSFACDYLDALLALSGYFLLIEARQKVFERLGRGQVKEVTKSYSESKPLRPQ
jgi:hypothetical protein